MITNHDLRHEATDLGKALQSATNWTPETRTRAIVLRARLFERGFYDPILGRLDSATVPQATVGEIAQQLTKIAEALN